MQKVERRVSGGPGSPEAGGLPRVRFGVLTGAVVVAAALGYGVERVGETRMLALYAIALLLGVALYHARFGFTSAFRQLVTVGQGAGLRAHMLMIAAASLLFAPILAYGIGVGGIHPSGYVYPLGLSVAVGAFMFGVGMQLGGACASGSLYTVGGGETRIVLTLFGFVVGSVLGAWNWGFWTQEAFNWRTISLADTRFGYAGAVVIQLAIVAAIVVVSRAVERRKRPPKYAPRPHASGLARTVRGTWPLWAGALALAVLNAATLVLSGKPWGITSAFALWGSKAAQAVGVDVGSWSYWSGDKAAALHAPVLSDVTSVMDFGIILGAMAAAAAGGTFAIQRRVPLKAAAAAIVGGILMGYGARIAYGCNIGAYFGGVASFSLHGWLWLVMALAGTYLGTRLRPLFGLPNPKPEDSSC